jgi:ribosomal-protein-alanine N-acetyltransferase
MKLKSNLITMKIFFETERFILREILEDDQAGFFAMDSDPEVHKYLGNKPVTSIEQTREIIKNVRNQYQTNGIGRWAIINKDNGDFMGWSGLKFEEKVRDFPYYDIGYRLNKKYWGQGIASETAALALAYGYRTLKLDEIFGVDHIKNIASNKILQKIGLQWKDRFILDGMECNWYRITPSEWIKKYSD